MLNFTPTLHPKLSAVFPVADRETDRLMDGEDKNNMSAK